MTIKECYQFFDGNYDDVLSRFRSEDRIKKYILKFLEDQSFVNLQDAIEEGNLEEAFRNAHTLKGLSQNLGFEKLSQTANKMTEALRNQDIMQAVSLLSTVHDDYSRTIQGIQEYKNNEQ